MNKPAQKIIYYKKWYISTESLNRLEFQSAISKNPKKKIHFKDVETIYSV